MTIIANYDWLAGRTVMYRLEDTIFRQGAKPVDPFMTYWRRHYGFDRIKRPHLMQATYHGRDNQVKSALRSRPRDSSRHSRFNRQSRGRNKYLLRQNADRSLFERLAFLLARSAVRLDEQFILFRIAVL